MKNKKMKINLNKKTTLLLIDVQQGFDDPYWGKRNNRKAEENMGRLLAEWRKHNRPVIHVKNDSTEANSPLRPDRPGNAIKDVVKPLKTEPVVVKIVNSAFIGTNLEKILRKEKITSLVIVGITTDHCVSTTTRMAANLGFTVYIVADATATFGRKSFDGKYHPAEEIHHGALVSLHNEFATVVNTADLLF